MTVVASNSLSAKTASTYRLLVRACANGDLLSCNNATVTVLVVDVPQAPVFNDTAGARSVPENSALGTLLSPNISAYDVDGDGITYSVVVSASYNGLVNVTSAGT